MAQTATPGPMCFCTTRKFCRNAVKDTSAQVGLVATRLASSMVATASDYSGQKRRVEVTGGLLPCALLPAREREVYRHLGFHLDRLIVQVIGTVTPLADGVDGGLHQQGMAAEHLQILDRPFAIDHSP